MQFLCNEIIQVWRYQQHPEMGIAAIGSLRLNHWIFAIYTLLYTCKVGFTEPCDNERSTVWPLVTYEKTSVWYHGHEIYTKDLKLILRRLYIFLMRSLFHVDQYFLVSSCSFFFFLRLNKSVYFFSFLHRQYREQGKSLATET